MAEAKRGCELVNGVQQWFEQFGAAMKRDTATSMMAALCSPETSFSKLDDLSLQIEDEAERVWVRRRLAEAMHALGYELVMNIVRQYPDLDPDKKA